MLVRPDSFPSDLQRARESVLIELPRAEFEARVRKARQRIRQGEEAPRLVSAHYRATLAGNALAGSAQWTVRNPSSAGGVLPLQPLNLALRRIVIDDAEAVVGDLDGKMPGLLVDQPGLHSVVLDWSARGDPSPEGLHFELKLPSCALTMLELDLPAAYRVVPRETYLLSGPEAASTADRRQWRLTCKGLSQIDLLVQQVAAAEARSPLVLSRLQTQSHVTFELSDVTFDLTLDVLHGSIHELLCECDASLQPLSVRVRGLEVDSWEQMPGSRPGMPATLRIRLPEPVQGISLPLRIHCLAPVKLGQRWTVPGLRVVGAVPLGETVALQLGPALWLEEWQSGDFLLVDVRSTADGGQRLVLQPRPGVSHTRPSARLTVQQPDFRVRQLLWWKLKPEGASLKAQLSYAIQRGQLYRLTLALPPGWEVERVEVSPRGLLQGWNTLPSKDGQQTLTIELQQPLEPPAQAQLTLELHEFARSGAGGLHVGIPLPFPQIIPLGTHAVEGALAVTLDPLYQATAQVGGGANAVIEGSSAGLSEQANRGSAQFVLDAALLSASTEGQAPDFAFTYRGRVLRGTLTLNPRMPRLRAYCTSEVILSAGRAALHAHLRLEPELGNPPFVDVHISAVAAGEWHWTVEGSRNRITKVQRLSALDGWPGLVPLCAGDLWPWLGSLAAPRPAGTLWRLHLAQPLREPLTLEATVDLAERHVRTDLESQVSGLAAANVLTVMASSLVERNLHEERASALSLEWEVPLVLVPSADPLEGLVRVHLAGTDLIQVRQQGLREIGTTARPGSDSAWRSFEYTRGPLSLVLQGHRMAVERSIAASADHVELTTYAEPGGRLLHHFRFLLRHWQQRRVPVRLPLGARVLAARVEGRWTTLPTLGPANGGAVELPVDTGADQHWLELVYAMEYPRWQLWTSLQAPAPVLPVESLTFQRTWCLPRGMTPLVTTGLQRLPGPAATPNFWEALEGPLRPDTSALDWASGQQRLLAEAESGLANRLRNRPGWRLGDALDYLLSLLATEKLIPVVDTVALAEAGLWPGTLLSEGGPGSARDKTHQLTTLGLVWVPFRTGPLLTTTERRSDWLERVGGKTAVGTALEDEVAAAARTGRDASGSLVRLMDWIQGPDAYGDGASSLPPGVLPHPEGWSAWQPLAGSDNPEHLLVIHPEVPLLLGGTFALLLVFIWYQLRQATTGQRYRLLLGWLFVSGFAGLWLPQSLRALAWWPFAAGIGMAGIWYLCSALPAVSARMRSTVRATVSSSLVAVTIGVLAGRADGPVPDIVWVLPSREGTAEGQRVLISPELLARLDALVRSGTRYGHDASLVAASYRGIVRDNTPEFQAEFRAYVSVQNSVQLVIPLGGVELREMSVDGKPAAPTAVAAPQIGYQVTLAGHGWHGIACRFTVPLSETGGEREIRFAVPELARNQLRLAVPRPAGYLRAVAGYGAQQLTGDAEGLHLEADLGRVSTLHLRWRQEGSDPRPPEIQATELALWDLQGTESRLLAELQYKIKRGTVTTVTVDLPENLEVRRVTADAGTASSPGPRLKQWSLNSAPAGRQLAMEFRNPLPEQVQVSLELVPTVPLGAEAILTPPVPLGVSLTEGYLAYHVEGSQSSPADGRRVTAVAPSDFLAKWQAAGMTLPRLPVHAYSFRRAGDGAPYLRLQLASAAPRFRALQTLDWELAPEQANLRATLQLTGLDEDFALVEWEVPPEVVIATVSGPAIRSWSRNGSRLTTWLQRSTRRSRLQLDAWVACAPDKPFRLPCLRLPQEAGQTTFLRMHAPEGQALRAASVQNLLPLPSSQASEQEQAYVTPQASYAAAFNLRPGTTDTRVRVLTLVEAHDRQLKLEALLHCEVPLDRAATLDVQLTHWDGPDVRLEAPPQVSPHEEWGGSGERRWTLNVPPGTGPAFPVKLVGQLRLPPVERIQMPEVRVSGARSCDRWLAVVGPELTGQAPQGLVPVGPKTALARSWPVLRDRLEKESTTLWQVRGTDWQLLLRPSSSRVQGRQLLVFSDEQSAVLAGERRWVHAAAYWLFQQASGDLTVQLPSEARLLRLTLDGKEAYPLPLDARRFWLPLPAGSEARRLGLTWVFADGEEPLEQPRLEKPRLQDVSYAAATEQEPTFWTVEVPPGYECSSLDASTGPDSAAARSVRLASGQLRLSRTLAESVGAKTTNSFRDQFSNAQQRFYRCCRYAEYVLSLPSAEPGTEETRLLPVRLAQLRDANQKLATEQGLEDLRKRAEDASLGLSAPAAGPRGPRMGDTGPESGVVPLPAGQGVPSFWKVSVPREAPRLRFTPTEQQQVRQAFGLSALLAVLLLLAGVLAYFPRCVAILVALGPEVMILIGLVAWQWLGLGPLAVFLVILGIAARLISLVRWGAVLLPSTG
jgi:hypothetical protein